MNVAVLLFEDFETLDVFGPVEILGRLKQHYQVSFHSISGGLVNNNHGVSIQTKNIDDLKSVQYSWFLEIWIPGRMLIKLIFFTLKPGIREKFPITVSKFVHFCSPGPAKEVLFANAGPVDRWSHKKPFTTNANKDVSLSYSSIFAVLSCYIVCNWNQGEIMSNTGYWL